VAGPRCLPWGVGIDRWQDAHRLLARNELAHHLLAAVKDYGFEHGRSTVVLRGATAISPDQRDFIAKRRAGSDAALAAALQRAEEFAARRQAIAAAWEPVRALRGQVDRQMALPRPERDGQIAARWLAAANALMAEREALMVAASTVDEADAT